MARREPERTSEEDERHRHIRRAALSGGVTAAALGTVVILVEGYTAHLTWWLVLPVAAVSGGFAAWSGARSGHEDGVRAQAVARDEIVLSTYTVRPPFDRRQAATPHENLPCQLRLTTRNLQLWKHADLLWSHPWKELRVTADGPRLRVFHQGQETGVLLVEPPGTAEELRLTARRLGAWCCRIEQRSACLYGRGMDAVGRPTLDEIEDHFVGLVAGRLSRDEADRWAAGWMTEDEIVWDDLSWWRSTSSMESISRRARATVTCTTTNRYGHGSLS
ncbi:hypothetical protein ABZX69_29065 [Streptomyces sp. NPDC004074]|uniref:hypothetical protein n=2 Tax=Streptomyces TaxID=1883 RepID=UPI0033BAA03B